MQKEIGKILIEGMDLSGKTTIIKLLTEILGVDRVQQRTLTNNGVIYDFTVAQSKKGTLNMDLINELYTLSIKEDLSKFKPQNNGLVLQDSYFALRSYALMKLKYPHTLAKEVYDLLQIFPVPEFAFYLTASTEERLRRNEQRNKPMAYMEKLLVTNPKEFETIENNLKDITTNLFNAEIIETQDKSPQEIAIYIANKIKLRYKEKNTHER